MKFNLIAVDPLLGGCCAFGESDLVYDGREFVCDLVGAFPSRKEFAHRFVGPRWSQLGL